MQKEPVRIRQKKVSGGNISLYLDIYINGSRSYDFPKIYIKEKPLTREDRDSNQRSLTLINAIKAQKLIEIQNSEYGFKSVQKSQQRFLPYFSRLRNSKRTKSTIDIWNAVYQLLIDYAPADITIKQVDRDFVKGFLAYLDKKKKVNDVPLSANTKQVYFSKLNECLKEAVREEIIVKNPADSIVGPKLHETETNHLSIPELQKLFSTPCSNDVLKRAFLFSCLTGLRHSDCEGLTWAQVHIQKDSTRIVFKQVKTAGREYLDVNSQVLQLMGEPGPMNQKVFIGFKYSTSFNITLKNWIKKAEISKKITFHCARHTFAVMMLELGAELFTVTKLLGHREISTTQRYAKVLDKAKQEAVAKIPEMKFIS